MEKADWNNTQVFSGSIPDEIKRLKQQSGKDIAIFASSELALTFIPHDLIDEFRILVNPVVLGSGKPLFKGLNERIKLKLLKTKTFNSGNVLLYYEPLRN
jgi:dihydrofolate reductase